MPPIMPPRGRRITTLLCLAITVACDAPPEWGQVSPLAGGTTAGRRLVGRSPTHVALVDAPRSSIALADGGCPASVVFAASGAERYAAWWSARPDSGVALVVARSGNGGREWDAAVAADARDRSDGGCDRPPPAIAADSASGYVHLAYFLRSADGSGIWFTHSMDGGLSWHAPVGITFGDHPGRTAVASLGDTVVVAYEDPSADARRIGIAISRTMGHIFDERLPITGTEGAATDPLLLLRPGAIAVAWTSRAGGADSSAASAALIRWGVIRATRHR